MVGGAVGAPEAGNMLGVPAVMSLQRFIASGAIWRPYSGLFFFEHAIYLYSRENISVHSRPRSGRPMRL